MNIEISTIVLISAISLFVGFGLGQTFVFWVYKKEIDEAYDKDLKKRRMFI